MNKNLKSRKTVLDGNGAAVEAIRLANVSVIAAYPITPQSPIVEKLSNLVSTGKLKSKYVCVESEHSALSYVIGAQLTGVRSGTATSSVGLALMHEVLGVASGCRLPIVMPIVNRALVAPWSLWCDHQDAMAERDSGWIQIYAENAQEVLDLMLIAYKTAEDSRVLTPAMVCMDGFFVSHSLQTVWVPESEAVSSFLPDYSPKNLFLDLQNPRIINNLTPPEEFTEMRYQQEVAFNNVFEVIPYFQTEYYKLFNRYYDMVSGYKTQDAQAVIVSIGSVCGTVKHVVDNLRKKGMKVGAVKITLFRPFPMEKLKELLDKTEFIGVIDRSAGLGAAQGPLCLEVLDAVKDKKCIVKNFICGLGGRDITEETIENIFDGLINNKFTEDKIWIDVRYDAMELRRTRDLY